MCNMYARHEMATERMFGVSIADLKVIAKTIKGQQALACELYIRLATAYIEKIETPGRVGQKRKTIRC